MFAYTEDVRPDSNVHQVFRLAEQGLTQQQIAAEVGIGQTTVGRWLRAGIDRVLDSPMRARAAHECPEMCPDRCRAPAEDYAYLLGQYLGDGSIVHTRGGVYRLFVTCCAAYPGIIDECRRAMQAVLPGNRVGQRRKPGAVDVSCYSKHWPCLFPQHGPGRKHHRCIVLEPWQTRLALDRHPEKLLRGLVHSDGSRCINRVIGRNGSRYSYVRYLFNNRSADIRRIFADTCRRLDIDVRQMNEFTLSVARKECVVRMDQFIGPKS
jgi:hypothetical protein